MSDNPYEGLPKDLLLELGQEVIEHEKQTVEALLLVYEFVHATEPEWDEVRLIAQIVAGLADRQETLSVEQLIPILATAVSLLSQARAA